MNYYQALRARKPVTTIPPGATRESVETAIADLTKALLGPMKDVERLMAVHERADCRDVLALMDGESAGG